MAVSEYHLDTRIRRRHVPLVTQQRRLRHLRNISVRNLSFPNSSFVSNLALSFTLHRKPDSVAFYDSEVISETLNPSWKDFESSNFPDIIDTACPYVTVKVWNMVEQKELLLEWVVFFSGLVFLGEQIPKEGKNFKPNTVIFGMSEGYYGCQDSYQHNMGASSEVVTNESLVSDVTGLRTSYTLSTLSRIKTVERAIKQTQAAVQKRRNNINDKLKSVHYLHRIYAEKELLKIKISVLKTELQYQQKLVHLLEKEVSCWKDELCNKRNDIAKKNEELKKQIERCFEMGRSYNEYRELLLKTEAHLSFRRKQLVTELGSIYPLVEFPDHNGFSIHDVHLPDSEKFAGHDETMIAIALGYVCHVLLMISQILNVPLRYSICFNGSRSSIIDHISSALPEKNREFPLFSKGKDRRFFAYGVFLLNKNIAQLRHLFGLSTRDLSATLPNLSSLLELRLSVNSETHVTLQNAGYLYNRHQMGDHLKPNAPAEKPSQNGFKHIEGIAETVPQVQVKVATNSEMDSLKKEMEAMIPQGVVSNQNILPGPKNLDTLNTLSCSLDKGLNDIKLMEKSLETSDGNKQDIKSKFQMKQLKQTHHHSSYPNLMKTIKSERLNGNNNSHIPPTPPQVWTAESSRTTSEEEQFEDPKTTQEQPAVLNDSIFYIPASKPAEVGSAETPKSSTDLEQIQTELSEEDFTADLTLRTEQLANRHSSFQLQRLRSSSGEEEHVSYA